MQQVSSLRSSTFGAGLTASAKHGGQDGEGCCCNATQGAERHDFYLIRLCCYPTAGVPCHCLELTGGAPFQLMVLGISCLIHPPKMHVQSALSTCAREIRFSWVHSPVTLRICGTLHSSWVIFKVGWSFAYVEYITTIESDILCGFFIESCLTVYSIPTVFPIWIGFKFFLSFIFTKFYKKA